MRRRSRPVAHIVGSNAKVLLTYQKPVAVSDGPSCGTVPVLWRACCGIFGVWVESDTPRAYKCRCGLSACVLCVSVSQYATGGLGQTAPIIARACKRLLTNVNVEKPTSAADMRFMPFQNVTFRDQCSGTFDLFTTCSKCRFFWVVFCGSSRLFLACSTASRPLHALACSSPVRGCSHCFLTASGSVNTVRAYPRARCRVNKYA